VTSFDSVTTISSAQASDTRVASCARSVTHWYALSPVLVGSQPRRIADSMGTPRPIEGVPTKPAGFVGLSAAGAAIWRRRAEGGHR
jgi:hypothetical protein